MSSRDSGAPPPEWSPQGRLPEPEVLAVSSWPSDPSGTAPRPLLVRRPALRWVVPAVVLVVALAVGGVSRMLSADAAPSLPPRTAAELLVDLQTAVPHELSGTVVQKSDLGLPNLSGGGSPQGSSDFTSMLTGTHTLRVWYGGEDKQRVALLGSLGESDVVRNGNDVWTWSSQKNEATHTELSDADLARLTPSPSGSPVPGTPQDAADRALAAISPTTEVTTDGTAKVAGRSAYELVLKPKDTASRIGQVRLAIDSEKKMPLRVRIYARGASDPAFEVGFTQVSFTPPEPSQFTFTPPTGATVTEQPAQAPADHSALRNRFSTVGSGWTTVGIVTGLETSGANSGPSDSVLGVLPEVRGSWGSGRLFESDLLCAVLTDDGRLVFGAVDPEQLYRAAAR